VFENSTLSGSNGVPVRSDDSAASSITVLNSTFTGNAGGSVFVSSLSSLDMKYTTVISNSGGGLVLNGTADINSSLIVLNSSANCSGNALPGTGAIHVNYTTDTDVFAAGDGGDCVNFDPSGSNNLTPANTAAAVGVATLFGANGGPTRTRALTSTSTSRDSADQSTCPTIDQRYFVRRVASTGPCDRGGYEFAAARDTTPPSCGVTAVRRGPDQQDVGVQDLESGLETILNLTITNGTVFTPTFARGERNTVTLTASKSDQTQKTRWSFTARDWAGNTTDCR
jgi:hypothetical protein